MTIDDALSTVLSPGPMLTFDSPAAWWRDHLARTASLPLPIDRAIAGATQVDRLGFAFAGGYAAALQQMVPSLDPKMLASFAATEEGGAHPRAIMAKLTREDGGGFSLTGQKRWVTLGPEGGSVLVVARLAEASGDRPRLRVVRVDAKAVGVTITALPEAAFVPEIPHASVRFENVRIASDAVLPGDGYDAYLKPFRTIEDLHVHAALWAWLIAIGVRSSWPQPLLVRAVALLSSVRGLSSEPATSPYVHIALAGLIEESKAIATALEPSWASVDADLRARWERDRVLLSVASAARTQRLAKAWETAAQRKA